jgi:acyl-CoA reductase-like NAD-dependent aldehyde dehydrogenase
MNFRQECMRIGGELVARERVIEILNPYTGACIGSVPRASVDDVRRAFDIAHAYRPRLSRYERSGILLRAAGMVVARTEEISELITAMVRRAPCRAPSIGSARARAPLLY